MKASDRFLWKAERMCSVSSPAGVIDEMSVFVAPVLAPSGLPAFGTGDITGLLRDAAYMHTHDAGRDIWIHAMFD